MGDDITLSDELGELQKWLGQLDASAQRLHGSYDEVEARLRLANTALKTARSEVEILEQVTTLIQGLEASWNKNFQKSLSRIISRGLTLVFEETMELRITTKVRADVTTVDFTIVQGEGKDAIETPILGAKGGTVIALVNVLIRALLILSARPPLRRYMQLDEPFGLADDSYIPAMGTILRGLCDKLGFQIVVVSHEEALVDICDVAYEVYKISRRKGSGVRQIRSRNEVHA